MNGYGSMYPPDWLNSYMGSYQGMPSFGESLNPQGAQWPTPSGIPGAPTQQPDTLMASPAPETAQAQAPGGNKLFDTLRGVQAPKPPEAQKPVPGHLPSPVPIKGGELINLLASMGIGPRDVYQLPRLGLGRGL